jgi:hypothetical protein
VRSGLSEWTTLIVYKWLLKLIHLLLVLNLVKTLQTKTFGWVTPRITKLPLPDSDDVIAAEIEVSQCCALCQHSCKPRYPPVLQALALIVAEIKRHQRCALRPTDVL